MSSKEPVYWGTQKKQGERVRAKRWNEKTKSWILAVDDRGQPLYEKVPQVGYVGPLNNARPMRSVRAIRYLRADGHITHVCVTNAAAHVHGADDSYLRDRRAKAKHFGWIEVGTCPVVEVLSRRLNAVDLISDVARNGKPCGVDEVGPDSPPCQHFLAEERARKQVRADENRKANEADKSESMKQTEALVNLATKMAEVPKK